MAKDGPVKDGLENDNQVLEDLRRKIRERWKKGDPLPPTSCLNEEEMAEWARIHQVHYTTQVEGISDVEWRAIEEEQLREQKRLKQHWKHQKTVQKDLIALFLFDPEDWEDPYRRFHTGRRTIPQRVPIRFSRIWDFVQSVQLTEVKQFDKTQVGEMLETLINEGRVEKFTLRKFSNQDENKPIEEVPPSHRETYYRLKWALGKQERIALDKLYYETEYNAAMEILKKHNLVEEYREVPRNYPPRLIEIYNEKTREKEWFSKNNQNMIERR